MPQNTDYWVPRKYFNTSDKPIFDTYKLPYDLDYSTEREWVSESIKIAGAPVNIFPLLGVTQIGSLIDLCENGLAISGGTAVGSSPDNAFNILDDLWISSQIGREQIVGKAWIGYFFGTIKNLANEYLSPYQPPVTIKNRIQSMLIRQAVNQENRALQVRVDISEDGFGWNSVAYVDLPNDSDQHIITFENMADFAYWRIVPTIFNSIDQPWILQYLSFYDQPGDNLLAIQDPTLLSNNNRRYGTIPIFTKCAVNQTNVNTNFSMFGIDIQDSYDLRFAMTEVVQKIGRPLLIGDIIEFIPAQDYSVDLHIIRKMLQVESVTWQTDSYSSNWTPTVVSVTCKKLVASRETMDITGLILDSENKIESKVVNNKGIDIQNIGIKYAEAISIEAEKATGQIGDDTSYVYNTSEHKNHNYRQADAIPPNGLPYTTGPTFPPAPRNEDYHRLEQDPKYNIPAMLYQYASNTGTWVFIETNSRYVQQSQMRNEVDLRKSGPNKKLSMKDFFK